MRHSFHLICASAALALTVTALIHGCGGNDLTVGGSRPIVSAVPSGAPTATPTCIPSGVGCSLTNDNCCSPFSCRSLTLTCG